RMRRIYAAALLRPELAGQADIRRLMVLEGVNEFAEIEATLHAFDTAHDHYLDIIRDASALLTEWSGDKQVQQRRKQIGELNVSLAKTGQDTLEAKHRDYAQQLSAARIAGAVASMLFNNSTDPPDPLLACNVKMPSTNDQRIEFIDHGTIHRDPADIVTPSPL